MCSTLGQILEGSRPENIELLSVIALLITVMTSLDFLSITKWLVSVLSNDDDAVLVQQTEDSRLFLFEGAAETSAPKDQS